MMKDYLSFISTTKRHPDYNALMLASWGREGKEITSMVEAGTEDMLSVKELLEKVSNELNKEDVEKVKAIIKKGSREKAKRKLKEV